MPNHDFECTACGNTERDLYFKPLKVPRRRRCGRCFARASEQIFDQFGIAQIDDGSSLYGRWHPQAGEVIRNYAHKRQLMKRYGWQEGSDPVKGNRKLSEEGGAEQAVGDGGMQWGSSEEARQKMKEIQENPHRATRDQPQIGVG